MKLPALSASAAPQFVDAASCRAWLARVPLANVEAAQHDLLAELEVFNIFPTAAIHRLAVMELVREAVSFVQIEQSKRFMNRPLPLAQAESEVFEDTVEMWEQMRLGYLRCLEAAVGGDPAMRAQAGLITQRLGAYTGLKMFHHHRAYREVAPSDWRALHEAYAHAERLGVAEEPVKDFLNRDIHDTSARIAYARAVLMAMSSPQELTQRQLTFVAFLLERWAVKLEISQAPVLEEKGVAPLVADLAGDRCPSRGDLRALEPRFLDTRKLAKSLRNRVGLLRKGESPARLALGEDCVQPSCEQLLVFLFRQWCQVRPALLPERRADAKPAQVCVDLTAIHHHTSGRILRRPLSRPVEQRELTSQQRQELETLGHIRAAQDVERSEPPGFMLEDWLIEDEGPQELRMRRPAGSAGKRYSHGQLVAVRSGAHRAVLVGQVRWLVAAADGELRVGLKRIPGDVAGVDLRLAEGVGRSEQTLYGLSIAPAPALDVPASLVLPPGSFKPARVVELLGDESRIVRLTELLERGADFERIAYERV